MASKKQRKLRNRIITFVLAVASGYVLLVNNSLDFLNKFGYNVTQTTNVSVAFTAFFLILLWAVWKASIHEI